MTGGGTAAVILAGGLSSRMGADKAFVMLGERPLLAHVLARLAAQVATIYLNTRQPDDRYLAFGRPLAVDRPAWRGAGPLAGIASALALARSEGFARLATAPCDAPFLPDDFVARLEAPILAGARAAVALGDTGREPMFALWPTDVGARLEAALAEGLASPARILYGLGAAEVRFDAAKGLNPFANLNSPRELEEAEAWLAAKSSFTAR